MTLAIGGMAMDYRPEALTPGQNASLFINGVVSKETQLIAVLPRHPRLRMELIKGPAKALWFDLLAKRVSLECKRCLSG